MSYDIYEIYDGNGGLEDRFERRVRTPVARREALLDAFDQSGMSGVAFAKLHGSKYWNTSGCNR